MCKLINEKYLIYLIKNVYHQYHLNHEAAKDF